MHSLAFVRTHRRIWTQKWTRFFSPLLVSIFLAAGSFQLHAQSVSLPFEKSSKGITITAKVGDMEGTFLLDTGSTRTIVTPRIARLSKAQLAATTQFRADNVALGGERLIPLASVRLTVGNTVFSDAYVLVTELKCFDGIIGLDLLSRFKSVKIDYENNTIELVQ